MTILIADTEFDHLLPNLRNLWFLGIKDHDTKDVVIYSDHTVEGLPKLPPVAEGIERLRKADRVVFHNGFDYDLPALAKVGFHLSPDNVFDTLVASRLYWPDKDGGHSLKALAEPLGCPKSEWTEFDRPSKGMHDYLIQDLHSGDAVYTDLLPKVQGWGESLELEHRVAYLIGLQKRNGFGFDTEGARKLLAELTIHKLDLEQQLQEVFEPRWVPAAKSEFVPKKDNPKMGYGAGCALTKVKLQDFNPGSRKQIADRLIHKYGWKPAEFTPSGEPEVSEKVLKTLKYPEAAVLCEYLAVDKKIGMLEGEHGWLQYETNGRVYGNVNPNGAGTGRMTHSRPNVAQADGDPRMRRLWVPRKGWKLVGTDAESLELCMLAHYLARYDNGRFGEQVTKGDKSKQTDAHSVNQQIANLRLRDSAKTLIYALIYGAGNWKLGMIVYEDRFAAGEQKPDKNPAQIGAIVRKRLQEGIVGLDKLVKQVEFKAASGYIAGLDGRKLRVRSKHSALNLLLQSAGAIVMKKALVLFHDKAVAQVGPHGERWAYCANVHDEVQIECAPEVAEQIGALFVDSITQAGIDLGIRCPLTGQSVVGDNWSETH